MQLKDGKSPCHKSFFDMKTVCRNRDCNLRAIGLIFGSCIIISCDGRISDFRETTKAKKDHQGSEIISRCKVFQRYSEDFVLKHDLAVTLWFAKQYHAMSVISFDDQNKVRLRSYKSFSKVDDKAENVLTYQIAAINEFVDSYHGRDKKDILGKWRDIQNEAKEVLQKFLKSVQMAPENVYVTVKYRNEYEKTIGIQERYLKKFVEYREGWKQSNPSAPTDQKRK
jgi:hypothetical protein